jgi:hypothetical protein
MTYRKFLLAAFVAVWTWAAIKPVFREDWLLENYLVFYLKQFTNAKGRGHRCAPADSAGYGLDRDPGVRSAGE